MKCNNCNKNTATFHYVERQGDQIKKDIHLCEECARQKGIHQHIQFSLSSVLDPLIESAAGPQAVKVARELAELTCPACGITFLEFRRKTRLGCARDYEVFQKGLVPLIEKIHGSVRHTGKIPPHAGERLTRQKELIELRRELDRQVKAEAYEEAARLRDRIQKLEAELQKDAP